MVKKHGERWEAGEGEIEARPEHSPIGASSYYRYSKCPGSVRLSKGMPEQSSLYAAEGTKAHELAAEALKLGSCNTELFEGIEQEMKDGIRLYVETVLAAWQVDIGRNMDRRLLVEHSFDLTSLHPDLYGTADAVVYSPSEELLLVYDFKYGKGVGVDVENNGQLMFYALGALLTTKFRPKFVEMVIVQPRFEHKDGFIRQWRVPVLDFLDFSEELVQAATATTKSDAPLKSGDHCRWCPAAGICPQIFAEAQDLAKYEFNVIPGGKTYPTAKLEMSLKFIPILEGWIRSVRDFAYSEANNGRVPKGWKLVPKKGRRVWTSTEKEMDKALWKNFNLGDDDIYQKKLKSVTQIEKLIPKEDRKFFNEIYTAKVSSGSTLVPSTDARSAIATDPKSEFKKIRKS